MGTWGDGTTSEDRAAIALEFRRVEGAPWFSLIDAEGRPAARSSISRGGFRRKEVVGTRLATHAFTLIDAIWLQDPRIAEVTAA